MHGLKKLFSFLSLPDRPTRGAVRDIWEKHFEAWRQSGLQQKEYCRRNNLSYDRFRTWKKRFGESSGTSIKLVEVKNPAHEFKLQDNSNFFHSCANPGNAPGSVPHGVGNRSGVGFWCGDFFIEVDENFSSGCLSQLLHVLHHPSCQNTNIKGRDFGGEDVDTNTGR